ncbi:hypothetical protein ACFU67_13295 [Streptomyces rhizosphaericola]|uniref:hypothetical protein n=1 Tax=Streptomyces rhizosphaericola TaxID=2564098 RepID=UPI0036AF4DD1
MTDTITAPWSSEQVAALEQFQTASGMHPFTCGADQHSQPPRLVPSHSGWYCPDPACDYRQDWAHAFMADPVAWPKPFGERHGPTPEQAREAVLAARGQGLERLHDRLAELRTLKDGWLDGHGIAPAANVIDFAGRLVTTLPRELDPILVTPTEAGGIQLEWSDEHGGHEIEIMPDLHLFLLTVEPGETP